MSDIAPTPPSERMPRWVWKAVAVFWGGAIVALAFRSLWASLYTFLMLLLVSLFLSLAVEPGVNRMAKRGWRRGTATAVILVGVLVAFLVFVVAIGALVGQQIAELLGNSEKYVTRTVNFLNDNFGAHIDAIGAAFGRKLDGVAQQVDQNLLEPPFVGHNRGHRVVYVQ